MTALKAMVLAAIVFLTACGTDEIKLESERPPETLYNRGMALLTSGDGPEAIRARLRRDLDNAKWLADQIEAAADWQLLVPLNLQTVCIRHQPVGLEGEALDTHTLNWVNEINQSGKAFMSLALLDGRWMVRISIGVEATTLEHLQKLWSLIQATAEKHHRQGQV